MIKRIEPFATNWTRQTSLFCVKHGSRFLTNAIGNIPLRIGNPATMEGTHGQLRARLTNRLTRDDANGHSAFDELAGSEIPSTDAIVSLTGKGGANTEGSNAGGKKVYYRSGLYAFPSSPFIPGMEAAGVVEAVGAGVAGFKAGDRVVYASSQPDSYAEYAVVPAAIVVSVPDSIDDQSAAAALLQGITAHFLTHSTYRIQTGDPVLIHAAAGGVGALLTQVAHHPGAFVIGTTSTAEKAQMAYEAGAHRVILATQEDIAEEVRRLTKGEGVAVVYDSVGKTTFEQSLHCLRRCGHLVLYGQSSGLVPAFEPTRLASKSLSLTRPVLFDYIPDRPSLLARAEAVLNWVATGKLRLRIGRTYPLAEAAQAHRDLESRAAVGKILLLLLGATISGTQREGVECSLYLGHSLR